VPGQSVELSAMLSIDHTNVLFGGSGDSLYFFDLVHSTLVQEVGRVRIVWFGLVWVLVCSF
jgi:hypothetical protein